MNQEPMFGGHSQTEVTQAHKDLIAHHTAQINTKLGIHATSFTINSVTTQIVAGRNYHFHLTANDGQKYTVEIYVPLQKQAAKVTKAEKNHN